MKEKDNTNKIFLSVVLILSILAFLMIYFGGSAVLTMFSIGGLISSLAIFLLCIIIFGVGMLIVSGITFYKMVY